MRFLRYIYRHELVVGITLFLFAVSLLIPFSGSFNWLTIQPIWISWLGVCLVVYYSYRQIHGKSYFPINSSRLRELGKFSVLGIMFCLALEFFGMYTTRLWYYPVGSLPVYLCVAPPAFSIYVVVLFIMYEAIKVKLSKHLKLGKLSSIRQKIYDLTLPTGFILGISGLLVATGYAINHAATFKTKLLDFTVSYNAETAWWLPFLAAFSGFLVFEFLAYKQGKGTLIKDLLRGDFIPLTSIVGTTILGIILIEFVNAPFQVWVFDNWPLNNVRFLNIPLLAFLAWPLQILVFLAMFRVFLGKKGAEIW